MLTMRGAKKDKREHYSDRVFDVFDDDRVIGRFVYKVGDMQGFATLHDKSYAMGLAREQKDESLYRSVVLWATGAEKPAPNPYLLTDAAGAVIAAAEPVKRGFAVKWGEESYDLRRHSLRRY